jgi:hypothetical protein
MLSGFYGKILWFFGIFSLVSYSLELFGIITPGWSWVDLLAVSVGLYCAFRMAKEKRLTVLERLAALAPWVVFADHFFGLLPKNFLSDFISILGTVATTVVIYILLGKIDSKKAEAKPVDGEQGPYPIILDEAEGFYISTKQVFEHVQVIGKSGSGKSASYFLNAKYQAIQQGKGCFSFDAKSEEIHILSYYAQEAGRMTDFVPFDLRCPERSDRINPLAWFTPEGKPDSQITSNIARQALYFLNESKDDYYPNLGKEFIRNLTGLLHYEFPIITFADYYHVVSSEIENMESVRNLCQLHPESLEAQYFDNHWLAETASHRREVLSGLMNLLVPFIQGPWAPLINSKNPTFLISDLVNSNRIFHFGAASTVYPLDYRKIACAFLMGAMLEVGRRATTPKTVPYDLFLDEFASIAYPGFEDIVEKVRSKGIGVHLGHQSMGDLERISNNFKKAIIDSTTTKIFFRVISKETAEECANIIGTKLDDPYMVKSVKTNAGLLGGYQEAGATIKEKDRIYVVHPDVIKSFSKGEAAVKVTYQKGVKNGVIHFKMAPEPPPDFDFTEVVKVRNYHKTPNEKSLPFKKTVAVAKMDTVPGPGKQTFKKDPIFDKVDAMKKELIEQRKPKKSEETPN